MRQNKSSTPVWFVGVFVAATIAYGQKEISRTELALRQADPVEDVAAAQAPVALPMASHFESKQRAPASVAYSHVHAKSYME